MNALKVNCYSLSNASSAATVVPLGAQLRPSHSPQSFLVAVHLLLLLTLSTFLAFYNLNEGSHWGTKTAVDEDRHIRVAQEMRLSGKWWLPTLDGKPYLQKPPLKIWATWIPTSILGESHFSYRLIDAVLAQGIVLIVYLFGLRMFASSGAAFWAAFSLLGNYSFFFFHGARSAVQDIAMLFLTTLMMLYTWRVYNERGTDNRHEQILRWAICAGILLGCAAMVKSAGAYYPAAVWFGFSLTSAECRSWLKRHATAVGLMLWISLMIPAFYYIPHFLFTHNAFEHAVVFELIDRFKMRLHDGQNTWTYFSHIAKGYVVPAWVLAPACVFALFRGFGEKDAACKFIFVWATALLAILSVLPSRLSWYMASCYVPFALMIGLLTQHSLMFAVETSGKMLRLKGTVGAARKWGAMASFIFFLFSASQGVAYLLRVGEKVATPFPRLEIDLITETIQGYLDDAQSVGQVVSLNLPNLAGNEHIYLNMIRPEMLELHSLDQALSLFSRAAPLFVLTSRQEAGALLEKTRPSGFAIIPRCMVKQGYNLHKRTRPIFVFSYLSQELPQGFKPMRSFDARVLKGPWNSRLDRTANQAQ